LLLALLSAESNFGQIGLTGLAVECCKLEMDQAEGREGSGKGGCGKISNGQLGVRWIGGRRSFGLCLRLWTGASVAFLFVKRKLTQERPGMSARNVSQSKGSLLESVQVL
jgi:hypothetical protein